MKISFVDLPRQNKLHKKEFSAAINNIISHADFIQGPALKEFEKNFAQYCDKKYCIGLNSGTDALLFGLLAYGIGTGDEVITAPNSYFSTAMVIHQTGAKAVFAEYPKSYTIDPDKIKSKITSRTRAIVPIHLYGQPANMDEIVRLAEKYNLKIIEDCCQAHGALYKDKKVPYTETGAFSFYPGKNLGSFGDGGALVTDNKIVANKLLLLRNDGSLSKYTHQIFGYKSRLDTIQAALLKTKLVHLDKWNKMRRLHASSYSKSLQKILGITTPQLFPHRTHVFHIYAIEIENRNKLKKHLLDKGIETIIHYPTPIHLQKPFKKLGFKKGDFPNTENAAKKLLSLPMFPELKDEEIQYIVSAIEEFNLLKT